MNRKSIITLELSFKGSREYIHGTTLYDAVIGTVSKLQGGNDSWVNYIVFRGFARSSCSLMIGSVAKLDEAMIRARFTIRSGGQDIEGCVFETGMPIVHRVPFAEELINQTATVEENHVFQTVRAGFSSIEEVVILTKYLHNVQLPSEQGRWVFSRLDMAVPFSRDEGAIYGVSIKQNLAGRMTVSDIEENGTVIGQIRFTRVEK